MRIKGRYETRGR